MVLLVQNEGQSRLDQGNMWRSWYERKRASRNSTRVTCGDPGTKKEKDEPRALLTRMPFAVPSIVKFVKVTCGSERQHVVIPVRNQGLPQLDQNNMW